MMESPERQIIRQFKLNHGLFLDGYRIELEMQLEHRCIGMSRIIIKL
jgi:hypothetical protein